MAQSFGAEHHACVHTYLHLVHEIIFEQGLVLGFQPVPAGQTAEQVAAVEPYQV